jgi:CubicO group peptidase (beta-lactamase class C family)
MAVMILVERGKLRFDETLPEIFPDFPAYGKRITIRHLLNHQSGLHDYEDLIPSSQTEQVSDEDVLRLLEGESRTYFTPGRKYRYCNGGYVLLGLAVERASGEDFSAFLHDNVFAPLQMTGSLMFNKGVSQVSHRAYGYTRSGGGFSLTDQSTTSATRGDGGVYTSLSDLFRWDQALYGSQLVSEEMLAQAFTPAKTSDGSQTTYGFGWQIDHYRGLLRYSHTGSTIGFRTAIARFPEKRFTVVVLVNRADVEPWEKARRIADEFLFASR